MEQDRPLYFLSCGFVFFFFVIFFLAYSPPLHIGYLPYDVWPSPGLLHYIYIFGGSCPQMEFYHMQNSLSVQVLHSPIFSALLYGTSSGRQPNFAAFSRGHHLYSAVRPSCWPLGHILVTIITRCSSNDLSYIRKMLTFCVRSKTQRSVHQSILATVHNISMYVKLYQLFDGRIQQHSTVHSVQVCYDPVTNGPRANVI